MTLDLSFLLAFFATLAGIFYLAWGGKARATNGADYVLTGRKASSLNVFGAITGTLVGGASTIGTAQLAFMYGLSAWWFTLGAGLACLFLGLFIAVPLRQSQAQTIPEFIALYHGERVRTAASLFTAAGMFIQIVAQLLACGAVMAVLFDLSMVASATISVLLVAFFTLGGGMKSAGVTGMIKMVLIYLTMAVAGLVALNLAGGWRGLTSGFAAWPWFSLFGYGIKEGVSDLVSMLVGVISTQTYLQAIFSANNSSVARRGTLLSAALIPPLGLFGILVGLFMRQTMPEIQSALALPTFILQHLPSGFAGIAFATLLIAAVGTASGLALGVATTLKVDLLRYWLQNKPSELLIFRLITLAVVVGAFILLLSNLGSAIMDWSFLSMGLRGATLCFPLLFAVFLPKTNWRQAGFVSIMVAPTAVVLLGFFPITGIPPLFFGLGLSLLVFLLTLPLPGTKS
ncbi:sodium:solute symporter family protein [Pelovirga terrestris]|uniref:Sodium:solute symporter family protein n=1 Tax=Pelovirga terrestris TaxID=2771352 RepID=A0A8J6UQK8_9BACT|nr:sodium:solute symporter family protein [Pelovirga terrestris]MBD1399151.1 sodium:solute symporter family protein [Pelovirga terrestris]